MAHLRGRKKKKVFSLTAQFIKHYKLTNKYTLLEHKKGRKAKKGRKYKKKSFIGIKENTLFFKELTSFACQYKYFLVP